MNELIQNLLVSVIVAACFWLGVLYERRNRKREAMSDRHDGLQRVYVFSDDESSDRIAELWTCSVPDVNEQIIIWFNDEHHHYTVTKRIFGANAGEHVGVWNLYVRPSGRFID